MTFGNDTVFGFGSGENMNAEERVKLSFSHDEMKALTYTVPLILASQVVERSVVCLRFAPSYRTVVGAEIATSSFFQPQIGVYYISYP